MTARVLPHTGDNPYVLRLLSDDENFSRLGEFLSYEDPATQQRVLCRVTQRRSVMDIDEGFLHNLEAPVNNMLEFISPNKDALNRYEVEAAILGHDFRGSLRVPREPAPVGHHLQLADDAFLEDSINKVPYEKSGKRDIGGIHLGHVLGRDQRVKVVLDGNSVMSTHLAVLAATGQGKSYTVGVILEELLSSHNGVPIIVFDMHGEYVGMNDIATKLKDGQHVPKLNVIRPNNLDIPIKLLGYGDLAALMPRLNDNQEALFRDAVRDWEDGAKNGNPKTMQELENCIINVNQGGTTTRSHFDGTIQAVANRFRFNIKDRAYFTDGQGKTLDQHIQPSTLTVVDLNGLGDSTQIGLSSVLMSLILKARQMHKNKDPESKPGKFLHLPYPLLMVIEEAHRLAPRDNKQQRSGRVLAQVAAEGRKFGTGLVMVTQRPGKINENVLSQCLTQIVSRISNPVDQNHIRDSSESNTSDLMALLPGLSPGEVIVFGHAIRTPTLCAVRQRVTQHHGGHGDPIQDARNAAKFAAAQVQSSNAIPDTDDDDDADLLADD